MKSTFIISLSFLCLTCFSCKQTETVTIDTGDADIRPAIITGHIANRNVYPKTKEMILKMHFFGTADCQHKSALDDDGNFSFMIFPYSLRDVSIYPIIDRMIVSPGDSIHVEADFSDFNKVSFSGRGAEDNIKLNAFYMKHYMGDWPRYSEHILDSDGIPAKQRYEKASEFKSAIDAEYENNMTVLQCFVEDEHPSKELAAFCRQEIEADYYTNLFESLYFYHGFNREDVSDMAQVSDAEYLFSDKCFNSKLCDLTHSISNWLATSLSKGQRRALSSSISKCTSFFKKSVKNKFLSQMLQTELYDALLEDNAVEQFEENMEAFCKDIKSPILRLSVRDKYQLKKANKENPRILSNAILNADKTKDGVILPGKVNPGLQLLRDVISNNPDKVIYISIGASWCPPCVQEKRIRREMARDYKGKPLKIVNINLDKGTDSIDPDTGMEDIYITDEQNYGLDKVLHLHAIPFQMLINKNGIIIDYGNHLRASDENTREAIDNLL